MQRPRFSLLSACLTAVFATAAFAGSSIRNVTVSPPFFNPTAGQSVTITFDAGAPGMAAVTILDRDRFPVRMLPPVRVAPGRAAIRWDGRDDSGAIVPDEAWNVRIDLAGQSYDPSKDFVPVSEDPQPRTYSRIEGVLSYRLSRPSRVHVEAGQAAPDPKTGLRDGPMMKTLVNREPRAAGAVVEMWNGFDDGGTIRVTDLPHFAVSVLATSLPDSSIITRGNRAKTFLEYARQQRPASAVVARKRAAPTHHHAGLDVFNDTSPSLRVKRSWTSDGALRMVVNVDGPTAAHFVRQPGKVTVYVDGKRVLETAPPQAPAVVTLAAKQLAAGDRRIAVNWTSDYGPAAAAAFEVEVRR